VRSLGHKASLTPPYLIPVSRQESERSCVLGICTLSLLDFGIDPTMWYFCVFHFTLSADGLDVNNLESGSAESFRKPSNIMLLIRDTYTI